MKGFINKETIIQVFMIILIIGFSILVYMFTTYLHSVVYIVISVIMFMFLVFSIIVPIAKIYFKKNVTKLKYAGVLIITTATTAFSSALWPLTIPSIVYFFLPIDKYFTKVLKKGV